MNWGMGGVWEWGSVHSVMMWDGIKVCGHCPLHIHFYGCWIGWGVVASWGTCRWCVQIQWTKSCNVVVLCCVCWMWIGWQQGVKNHAAMTPPWHQLLLFPPVTTLPWSSKQTNIRVWKELGRDERSWHNALFQPADSLGRVMRLGNGIWMMGLLGWPVVSPS